MISEQYCSSPEPFSLAMVTACGLRLEDRGVHAARVKPLRQVRRLPIEPHTPMQMQLVTSLSILYARTALVLTRIHRKRYTHMSPYNTRWQSSVIGPDRVHRMTSMSTPTKPLTP